MSCGSSAFCVLSFNFATSAVRCSETHIKRQATQHGCLSSWLGNGDKGIGKVYGEEKIFCTGPTRAAKAGQDSNLLYRHDKPNETTKKGLILICSLWDPIHLSFNSQQGTPLSSLSGDVLMYSTVPQILPCPRGTFSPRTFPSLF